MLELEKQVWLTLVTEVDHERIQPLCQGKSFLKMIKKKNLNSIRIQRLVNSKPKYMEIQ